MNETSQKLAGELTGTRRHDLAIALDFDGVCKMFTEHKHQIMSTALFIHLREFQRVPFEIFRQAYVYINFRSPDYAGKERFLCANALAEYLTKRGYNCAIPGLHAAVKELLAAGKKISADNLKEFATDNDVTRALAWSDEVNQRTAMLTEIRLTPGILSNILTPFRELADFYIISTATEGPLRASMEQEDIDFIRRYFGQETATKTESLLALGISGYKNVFMFGDSVEDERASTAARVEYPEGHRLIFIPVIPGNEERCFEKGNKALKAVMGGDYEAADKIAAKLARKFKGNEAGSRSNAPMSIRS